MNSINGIGPNPVSSQNFPDQKWTFVNVPPKGTADRTFYFPQTGTQVSNSLNILTSPTDIAAFGGSGTIDYEVEAIPKPQLIRADGSVVYTPSGTFEGHIDVIYTYQRCDGDGASDNYDS